MTDTTRVLVAAPHPATGEVLDLVGAVAPELLDALEDARQLEERVADYRRAIELELVRRADARGKRTVLLDGCKVEVNAPTEDHYDPADVRRELEPLVEAGTIDRATLDALIVTPPPPRPTTPAPRVDKRVVNGLKSSDNRELLAALARARRRTTPRRTVKVLGRPVEATAIEEAGG